MTSRTPILIIALATLSACSGTPRRAAVEARQNEVIGVQLGELSALGYIGDANHDQGSADHAYAEHAGAEHGTNEAAAAMDEMMAGMSAEDMAMFEAWGPFMTPGTQHAALASIAGRWDLEITSWMRPGAEAMSSTAVGGFESFGGGRYLLERVESNGPMGPFEGFGITGFNNRTHRYFNYWIDSMGTGVMAGSGYGDEDAMKIRYEGTIDDPITGGEGWYAAERRVMNDDTFTYTMWMEMDGTKFKTMEITYTRAW